MPSDGILLSRGTREERFWSNVTKTPFCWLWTGSRNKDGYGQFGTDHRTVGAHVYSFYLHNGRWPSGEVCHSTRHCARRCVNPYHLHDGTHAENMREIYQHRREWINENADLRNENANLKMALGLLENENDYLAKKNEKFCEFIDELIKVGLAARRMASTMVRR